MRTTVELPDDLFRQAKAHAALQGRALKDIVADGLTLLLQAPTRKLTPGRGETTDEHFLTEEAAAYRAPARKRGSAGAWATRFIGVAKLPPGETTDDARMDHYRNKYGS